MPSPLLRIRDLAEGQWGLVTLRLARAAGVGWQSIVRLTDTGLLERVAHGVDNVNPDSVAQITVEVLNRVFDYPRVVAESLAPHAARFGLPQGDGVALLDCLLSRANYRRRDEVVSLADLTE